jgi:hypothetical protein
MQNSQNTKSTRVSEILQEKEEGQRSPITSKQGNKLIKCVFH